MTNLLSDAPLNRPIGFWIRSADSSLTSGIDRLHRDLGLSREDWQVLNTLVEAGGRSSLEALLEAFAPMLSDEEMRNTLNGLKRRRLIANGRTALKITVRGFELHRRVQERQLAFRKRVTEGISEADYAIAVVVLAKLVANCRPGNPPR